MRAASSPPNSRVAQSEPSARVHTANTSPRRYSNELGTLKLIAVFEQFKAFEGMYYYLGAIINFSEEPEVHLKCVERAQTSERSSEAAKREQTRCFASEAAKQAQTRWPASEARNERA